MAKFLSGSKCPRIIADHSEIEVVYQPTNFSSRPGMQINEIKYISEKLCVYDVY
jgi:hypothetical protein